LKYPEKSALFADQIKAVEKLQEKIKKSWAHFQYFWF
jgi:hypothetical protein